VNCIGAESLLPGNIVIRIFVFDLHWQYPRGTVDGFDPGQVQVGIPIQFRTRQGARRNELPLAFR
jgi:hypothetical protein